MHGSTLTAFWILRLSSEELLFKFRSLLLSIWGVLWILISGVETAFDMLPDNDSCIKKFPGAFPEACYSLIIIDFYFCFRAAIDRTSLFSANPLNCIKYVVLY